MRDSVDAIEDVTCRRALSCLLFEIESQIRPSECDPRFGRGCEVDTIFCLITSSSEKTLDGLRPAIRGENRQLIIRGDDRRASEQKLHPQKCRYVRCDTKS